MSGASPLVDVVAARVSRRRVIVSAECKPCGVFTCATLRTDAAARLREDFERTHAACRDAAGETGEEI